MFKKVNPLKDLLEQNDALINALKDSEHKLDTSVEVENTLLEEVQVAKGFEEQLARARDEKIGVERELDISEQRKWVLMGFKITSNIDQS